MRLSPFRPGRAFLNGEADPVLVWCAELAGGAPSDRPGRVLARAAGGFDVTARDGVIRVT